MVFKSLQCKKYSGNETLKLLVIDYPKTRYSDQLVRSSLKPCRSGSHALQQQAVAEVWRVCAVEHSSRYPAHKYAFQTGLFLRWLLGTQTC